MHAHTRTNAAHGAAHDAFKELARVLAEADAQLLVAAVPVSTRDDYLLNPRLAVRATEGGQRAPIVLPVCSATLFLPLSLLPLFSGCVSFCLPLFPATNPSNLHTHTHTHTHQHTNKPQRRYGLHAAAASALPQFRLFLRGYDLDHPIEYRGAVAPEAMSRWLVAEANVFVGRRGQLEALDAAAKELFAVALGGGGGGGSGGSGGGARAAAVVARAEKAAAALELDARRRQYAEYYLRTMRRVAANGTDHLARVGGWVGASRKQEGALG